MDTTLFPAPATRKKRDPLLVFVAMPKKDENLPACTRALWDLVKTGNKLEEFTFVSACCTSFSSNKSRNVLTALGLSTDAGVMLQVDADMNAGPEQLLSVLRRPEKVVGGIYPKKEISLKQSWVANFAVGAQMRADGLMQCVDIGAGFLKTDLGLVEDMTHKWPETGYVCEDAPWRGETMWDLWSAGNKVEDWQLTGKPYSRYLTDDFFFCWRVRQMGLPVWADCRAQCGHWGGVDFLEIVTLIEELTKTAEEGGVRKDRLPPVSR